MRTRTERDSMGAMEVPETALYGAQTQRAVLNFPVSGWPLPRLFLTTLAGIKRACAQVNHELGKLDADRTAWIESAAGEIVDGELLDQFPVDLFQTGSGTSTNMNMNEVISNRAIQLAGGVVGSKDPIHPNDHVNMGQSSNDVIPTALHVAGAVALARDLLPTLDLLHALLDGKAKAWDGVVKIGRTHLQDATPIRMGQVFGGFARQVQSGRERVAACLPDLCELALGGTAVGTGLNTHPEFGARVAAKLADLHGLPFQEAADHVEAQAARDGVVRTMATLKGLAVALGKIANDIRLLASGPRCGLGELRLPPTQPGSSIMPGKVNPVICESVMQVAAHVVGADAAVAHGAATLSNFELSVALPLMAHHLLESIRLLANAGRVFAANALDELACDTERCGGLIEESLALCTSLAPAIGYDAAAEIAKEAYESGRTVRAVALAKGVLPEADLQRALDPLGMTRPE